jgi:aquaporin Z
VSSDRFPPDTQQTPRQRHGVRIAELLEREPPWSREFADLSHEWRRLFSELFGTFMLVIVGAGGAVVDAKTADGIGRTADVVAPGLLVLTVILFMGAVSGAHLNPVVSIAFALRQDFQWRRVPGYILADMRAAAACLLLRAAFGTVGALGATLPHAGFTSTQTFFIETLLTLGLVSTILCTASSAQNIGPLSAVAVGAYMALAGLLPSPVSGAPMNPAARLDPIWYARCLTPACVARRFPRPLDTLGRTDTRRSPGRGGGPHPPRPGWGTVRVQGRPRNPEPAADQAAMSDARRRCALAALGPSLRSQTRAACSRGQGSATTAARNARSTATDVGPRAAAIATARTTSADSGPTRCSTKRRSRGCASTKVTAAAAAPGSLGQPRARTVIDAGRPTASAPRATARPATCQPPRLREGPHCPSRLLLAEGNLRAARGCPRP